jgi:DNA-directed RNA polymerase subunit RPC12/RpoP
MDSDNPTAAIRCPYCVEGKSFKAMIARGGGDWYMCVRCGHLMMTKNPSFECTCAKCVTLNSVLLQRSQPRRSRHR